MSGALKLKIILSHFALSAVYSVIPYPLSVIEHVMRSIGVFLIAIGCASPVLAVVDMKNANYASQWTDLQVSGAGFELRVKRTYNSKTSYSGLFGYGWCSDFETRVQPTAEGNIRLTECGAGQEIVYMATPLSKEAVAATVARIVDKVRTARHPEDARLQALVVELGRNSALRTRFALAYAVATPLQEGQVLYAAGVGLEQIRFEHGVYTRTLEDGTRQTFNANGLLQKIEDLNHNSLQFEYRQQHLQRITHSDGQYLDFSYLPDGRLDSISASTGVKALYQIAASGDLVRVINSWKHRYDLRYDSHHQLTAIHFPDHSRVGIRYNSTTKRVLSFTDRQGCRESYSYQFVSPQAVNHYIATARKTCGKRVVSRRHDEFWYVEGDDGAPFLQQVSSIRDGDFSHLLYHPRFGKPLQIQRHGQIFRFTYYDNGQLKSRQGSDWQQTFTYDPIWHKLSGVLRECSDNDGKMASCGYHHYGYDERGNLNTAEDNNGQKMALIYDTQGRIATMTDQENRVLHISYDARFGKPEFVSYEGVGNIHMTYGDNGEVKDIQSEQDNTLALEIASLFNNMLELVADATQDFY